MKTMTPQGDEARYATAATTPSAYPSKPSLAASMPVDSIECRGAASVVASEDHGHKQNRTTTIIYPYILNPQFSFNQPPLSMEVTGDRREVRVTREFSGEMYTLVWPRGQEWTDKAKKGIDTYSRYPLLEKKDWEDSVNMAKVIVGEYIPVIQAYKARMEEPSVANEAAYTLSIKTVYEKTCSVIKDFAAPPDSRPPEPELASATTPDDAVECSGAASAVASEDLG